MKSCEIFGHRRALGWVSLASMQTFIFHWDWIDRMATKSRRKELTDGIELNVRVTKSLRIHYNLILRFAVGNKDADFTRIGSHTHIWFEVVLEDVVQGHTFGNRSSRLVSSDGQNFSLFLMWIDIHVSCNLWIKSSVIWPDLLILILWLV